ncbi:MAG: MFS transporter [Desulfobacteraceae bacterium]|jgi:MFS family permease|nr:MFS transporter [Desulfobacteraceae bacterium]
MKRTGETEADAMPLLPDTDGDRAFWAQLTICCLITFIGYLAVSMRLPVVPLHARALGATATQIGLINAAFYFMAGCLSLPAGALADRFGRRRLTLAGSFGASSAARSFVVLQSMLVG